MDFDRLIRDMEGMDLNLYDFALYENGQIQAHRFQPSNRCNDSYSVAKAFVITALGLLWDEGKLDVHERLADIFQDEFPADAEPKWARATVEHAMKHRIGFQEGFLDIDVENVNTYEEEDYLQIVLKHPLAYEPGTHEQYSDAAFYLLSRVVSRKAGVNLDSLLLKRIFRPLGFQEVAWSRCPLEIPIGATGLYISSQDMVKLGALYANGGLFRGKRLLSRAWVNEVLSCEYEFHKEPASSLYGKGGMYGQALMFSPKEGSAVAWHGFQQDAQAVRLVRYMNEMFAE